MLEQCLAKTKRGGFCTKPAGWRTEHPGSGRCHFHGGSTPVKTGRYSSITRPRIAALLKEFEADTDPLNLLPEVLLLRSLIVDYVERYDAFTEALFAWHESFNLVEDDDGNIRPVSAKPRQMIDILSAAKFIGEIGGLVDKISKAKKEGTITLATLDRVIEQHGVELVKAIGETVSDEAQRQALLGAVERRWGTITLDLAKPGA